jgi:peptidoglycan/xylan/chitin deacetylase (PgdA/CDA1 family)
MYWLLVPLLFCSGLLVLPLVARSLGPTWAGVRLYGLAAPAAKLAAKPPAPPAPPTYSITIDDGPSEHSWIIEEVLRRHKVTAHWFAIGEQVERYPDVVARWVAAGHFVHNHDWTSRISLLATDLKSSVLRTDATIAAASGAAGSGESALFRPGCGLFSARMVREMAEIGKTVVLGDVYAHDPFWSYFPLALTAPLLEWHARMTLRNGSILILHDGSERRCRQTAAVLDRLLTSF